MSVICPKCYKNEIEGTFFCPDCGTKLFEEKGVFTTIVKQTDTIPGKHLDSIDYNLPIIPDDYTIENHLSLQIIKTGQILPLVGRTEYSIGRISQGQSVLPDVDLTPFDAYTNGVSRLHAIIKIKDQKVILLDLNSANGTKLNRKKLKPRIEHQIKNGDVIKLGKLRIQALIRVD